MSGVILSLTKSPRNELLAWVEDAPTDHPDAKIAQILDFSALPSLSSEADTRAYAVIIRDQFLQFEAFKSALDAVFNSPAGSPANLRFQLRHPICEAYSWETLVNGADDFVALSSRAHISRQVAGGGARIEAQLFKPPLKILAILSAVGVSARGQWQGLEQALSNALNQGLVTLDLLTCEPDLLADIRAANRRGVTAEAIPDTLTRLLARIAAAAPNILHFFCHGRVGAGIQTLEMVPIAEWLGGASTGALSLGLEKLQAERSVKQAWLTVLNCCLGGAPAANGAKSTHSMAMQLVKAGAANAVGMTDPIDASDAHDVAEAFYTRMISDLAPLLERRVEETDLDFSPAIGAARDALHVRTTQNRTPFTTWTLPVLYEGAIPLRVRWGGAAPHQPGVGVPPPPDEETARTEAEALDASQIRLQIVAGWLKNLAPDAPVDLRLRALRILSEEPAIPVAFWPDMFGRFTSADQPVQRDGQAAVETLDHA